MIKTQWKPGKTDRRFWVRMLAGVLGIALLFTILSRVSASMTVARVSAENPSAKALTHPVEAQGQVEVRREAAEVTQADLLVKSVSVREGESVEAGTELFRVDLESLAEKMEEIEKEIESLELQNDALAQNESLDASQRQTNLNRAREDYADTTAKNQKSVASANQALSEANQALNESASALSEAEKAAASQQIVVENLEKQLAACTAAQSQAEAEVEQAKKDVDSQEAVLKELQSAASPDPQAIQQAEEKLSALSGVLSAKQEALSEAAEAVKNTEAAYEAAAAKLETLKETVTAAKQQVSQDQADVRGQESTLSDTQDTAKEEEKSAARAVEDAAMGGSADASQEINELSIEEWQKKLDKLKTLQDTGGVVNASQSGIVTKLYVEAGQKTTDTAAVMLGDITSGFLFTALIDKDDVEYVSVGDMVSVKGVGKTAEDCPVISLKADETGEQVTVTAELKSGTFTAGETATMEAGRTSEQYPYTVPASALLQEDNKTYVMVVDTEETVLGSQYIARKVEVDLLDKNAVYAAIESESLSEDTLIITEQDRYVEAGDRIRLKEQ